MARIYRLDELRKPARATFFDRYEMNQLLSLYSRRVASGEWRDYAIDQSGGSARFSIFRHTLDAPAYTIAKRTRGMGRDREYVVLSGRQTLMRATTMSKAIAVFERRLHVVS